MISHTHEGDEKLLDLERETLHDLFTTQKL